MKTVLLVTFLALTAAALIGCDDAAAPAEERQAPDAAAHYGGGDPGTGAGGMGGDQAPPVDPEVPPTVCLSALEAVPSADPSDEQQPLARLTVSLETSEPLGLSVTNVGGGEPMALADYGAYGDEIADDGTYSRLVRVEQPVGDMICGTPEEMGMIVAELDHEPTPEELGAGDEELSSQSDFGGWGNGCPYTSCSASQSACFECGGGWGCTTTCICSQGGWCYCWTVCGCHAC